MKLFQKLLVATASVGLIAPITAQASDVINLQGMNDYSRSKKSSTKKHFDSKTFVNEDVATLKKSEQELEILQNNFEAGSFSETTTASFSADMAIGDEDTAFGRGKVNALYGFQIDLNTSFTGEDSLDISLDAGNGGNGLSELDLNEASAGDDSLAVDGISYTFPVAGATVFVGDNTDGSALYNTACVYGGPSNNLDDCGNGSSALGSGSGTAAGASYEFADGFTAAIGYTGDGSSTSGLMTAEGYDSYGAQVSYSADLFAASVTYGKVEAAGNKDRNYLGLNGYFAPSETGIVPSISAGYEVGEGQGLADTYQWFVGLQWDEAGPGTLGTAVGTVGATTDTNPDAVGGDGALLMYEAFYSYALNDGVTITPLVYFKEAPKTYTGDDDLIGLMLKTSFSF